MGCPILVAHPGGADTQLNPKGKKSHVADSRAEARCRLNDSKPNIIRCSGDKNLNAPFYQYTKLMKRDLHLHLNNVYFAMSFL